MDNQKELLPVTVIANILVPHYKVLAGDKYEPISIFASCQLIADEIIAKAEPLIKQETVNMVFEALEGKFQEVCEPQFEGWYIDSKDYEAIKKQFELLENIDKLEGK